MTRDWSRCRGAEDGVLVATDGSSIHGHLSAGWGAIVEQGPGSSLIHGPVEGADQTSWAAETVAALKVLHAAKVANRNVVMLIDNSTVLSDVKRVIGGQPRLPKYGFKYWHYMRGLVEGLSHRAYWVPSHGKRPRWRPDDPQGDPIQWRSLNSRADLAAGRGAASKAVTAGDSGYMERCARATNWAHMALDRLYRSSRQYVELNPGLQQYYRWAISDNDA